MRSLQTPSSINPFERLRLLAGGDVFHHHMHGWGVCLFGDGAEGVMRLSEAGRVSEEAWQWLAAQ